MKYWNIEDRWMGKIKASKHFKCYFVLLVLRVSLFNNNVGEIVIITTFVCSSSSSSCWWVVVSWWNLYSRHIINIEARPVNRVIRMLPFGSPSTLLPELRQLQLSYWQQLTSPLNNDVCWRKKIKISKKKFNKITKNLLGNNSYIVDQSHGQYLQICHL